MQVEALGWEDSLEEGMATQFSILAWRIPMDRGTWWATVYGLTGVKHDLVTKPPRSQRASLVAQMVKNPPSMWESWV